MKRTRGFTLIELLVVISIISILIGLLMPTLAASRENSRQLKCLTNLKGMGVGINLYLQGEGRGIFPNVLVQDQQGNPAFIELLADYVDAATPRRDVDGVHFLVSDPYLCPSDIGDPENGQAEPTWSLNGTSYDYPPGLSMFAAELFFGFTKERAAFAVTKAFENARSWPFVIDAGTDWHRNRSKGAGPRQNALYYPDWRADWNIEISTEELEKFLADVQKFGGGLP